MRDVISGKTARRTDCIPNDLSAIAIGALAPRADFLSWTRRRIRRDNEIIDKLGTSSGNLFSTLALANWYIYENSNVIVFNQIFS